MARRGGFPGGMPGNMTNLMKQAQKMQRQMEEKTKELEEKQYTATAVLRHLKLGYLKLDIRFQGPIGNNTVRNEVRRGQEI